MSKITKPKRNYLYSPYDIPSENGVDDDMLDPVLSGLPSNLTRNLWEDWNDDNVLQDDTTLANFASGMDMTYEEKQPQVSLLDSLMAEGSSLKGETNDMMSPPASVRSYANEISDMMLPPPVQTTTQFSNGIRPRTQSNPQTYNQFTIQKVPTPISPPRETMANLPAYTPPQAHTSNSSQNFNAAQFNDGTQSQPMYPGSTMAPFTQQLNNFSQQTAQSTTFHHQQMQSQPTSSTSSNNNNTNNHNGFPGNSMVNNSSNGFNAQVQSIASNGNNFNQQTNGFLPSAFGGPQPNMMMPPSGFMMYNNSMMGYQNPHHAMMNSFMPMNMHTPINMAAGSMNMPMPFPMAVGPGGPVVPPTLAAKPPLKPHVPLARKPGTGEISSMLQSLLNEEAEKRDKKLERNRDSARESRKKQQKYVEVLEDGIQHLQLSKESLLRFRFGRSPLQPQQLDVMCGLSVQTPSFSVVMQAARQRRLLGQPKNPLIEKVFTALARTLALLQSSLLEMQMLWDADSNGLKELLGLNSSQVQQLEEMGRAIRQKEMLRIVLLVKAFKALRRQAFELGSFAPSLDVYFRSVLSPDQVNRMITWSETNRNELMRIEWWPRT